LELVAEVGDTTLLVHLRMMEFSFQSIPSQPRADSSVVQDHVQ
jgi:hypothetical protein